MGLGLGIYIVYNIIYSRITSFWKIWFPIWRHFRNDSLNKIPNGCQNIEHQEMFTICKFSSIETLLCLIYSVHNSGANLG